MSQYRPAQGDIVWVDFDPQAGHEQAKRRPALVISNSRYNAKGSMFIVCPITSQVKSWPFAIPVEVAGKRNKVEGVVLSDQIKSFDYVARNAELYSKASNQCLETVILYSHALTRKGT